MSGKRKKKRKVCNKALRTDQTKNDNCSENAVINLILKGLVFVQEADNETSIEYFMAEHLEKYKFLLANESDNYEVNFQGSSVEGLCIYGIEEKSNPASWCGHVQFAREFDFDVMYVSKETIISEDDFSIAVALFLNDLGFEEWKKDEYCLHEKEPFVKHFVKGSDNNVMCGFSGITRPACNKCISDEDKKFKLVMDYQGRPMKIVQPEIEMVNFMKDLYSDSHPGQTCDSMKNPIFDVCVEYNRYGDLCYGCKRENNYQIKHSDTSKSTAFLDKVHFQGPSILTRFYMNTKEKDCISLPLFTEPNISTIDLDHIVAFRYPAELGSFNWPIKCLEFVTRKRKSGWPSNVLIQKAVQAGCHLVPKSFSNGRTPKPKTWLKLAVQLVVGNKTWRVSFSAAEKVLAKSMSLPQRKCFLLLKFLFNVTASTLNRELYDKFGEGSYETYRMSNFLLKHVMFWTIENTDQLQWRTNNMFNCIRSVLNQFERFLINDGLIPHYFYGKRKNLLWDEADKEKRKSIIDRYLILSKTVGSIEWIVKAITMQIFFKPADESQLLDYQWNIHSDELRHGYLLATYAEMVACCQFKNEHFEMTESAEVWNRKVVAHYKSMIKFVTNTSVKRYGLGVNKEFLRRLRHEKICLEQNKDYDLDKDEMNYFKILYKKSLKKSNARAGEDCTRKLNVLENLSAELCRISLFVAAFLCCTLLWLCFY